MGSITALILAGSRGPTDPVAMACGVSHKALAPIAGSAMLYRVISTLAQSPEVGRIVVTIENSEQIAAHPALVPFADRITFVEAAASPSLSVLRVLDCLPAPFPLLITTADHPLLTPAMVRHFLEHQPAGCAASIALARAETIRAAYPDTRRTYLRFRNGWFSGCNLFLLKDESAKTAVTFWRTIEAERKRPWRMVRQLGIASLIGFLLGRLTLERALTSLGARVGLPLGYVEMPFAEAAIDVDKAADLNLAERILLSRVGKVEAG